MLQANQIAPPTRTRDWVWAGATPWGLGVIALLCDHFQPDRPTTLGMHVLFAVATCMALCLVLIVKSKDPAITSAVQLHLFARLVSRWVYVLIYVLALTRVGLYMYEVTQSCDLCGIQDAVRPVRSLSDFQFYIACSVFPLWIIRAVALGRPFKTIAVPAKRPAWSAAASRRPWYVWATMPGLFPLAAHAGGPLGIDHKVALDEDGIWSRKYQEGLEYGVIATEIGGALWLGNDDDLGHTMWQTLDSSIISGVVADVLKVTVGRPRPDQTNDPNAWFKGSGHESFPSGEVTLQASFVTPLIVRYAKENPWIWTLEALPLYDAVARVKSQAHWQSDVLAGWMIGTGIGYWTSTWKIPLTVRVLPGGLAVGLSKRF